jgi:hypothetical protein
MGIYQKKPEIRNFLHLCNGQIHKILIDEDEFNEALRNYHGHVVHVLKHFPNHHNFFYY